MRLDLLSTKLSMTSVSPKVAVRREMLALKGDIMAVSDDMGRSKGTFTMVCVVVCLGGGEEHTRWF